MRLTKLIKEITDGKSYLKYFKEFIIFNYIDPLSDIYSQKKITAKLADASKNTSSNIDFINHSLETVKEGVLKCKSSEDAWDYFIKHILAIKGIDDKIRYKYADLRKGENICQIYFDFINGKNSFKLNYFKLK